MDIRFGDSSLDQLEADPKFDGDYPVSIVTAFRKCMQVIRAAPDEIVFSQMKFLHFQRLKDGESEQYSIRLNDQWQLIVEFQGQAPNRVVIVDGIRSYH